MSGARETVSRERQLNRCKGFVTLNEIVAGLKQEGLMWVGRMVVVVIGAGMLSGCATGKTRADLARLQSQVGLLEERVGQLERSGLSGSPSTSSWSETSPAAGAAAAPVTEPAKGAVTVKHASSKSTLKPTTREIQQALKNAGFYQGPVDGKMGAQTGDAIKEFQRVHGLTDDGVAGKHTWAKLKAYANLSSGSNELNAAEILK